MRHPHDCVDATIDVYVHRVVRPKEQCHNKAIPATIDPDQPVPEAILDEVFNKQGCKVGDGKSAVPFTQVLHKYRDELKALPDSNAVASKVDSLNASQRMARGLYS